MKMFPIESQRNVHYTIYPSNILSCLLMKSKQMLKMKLTYTEPLLLTLHQKGKEVVI
jgi:hypothetical protein